MGSDANNDAGRVPRVRIDRRGRPSMGVYTCHCSVRAATVCSIIIPRSLWLPRRKRDLASYYGVELAVEGR